MSIEKVLESLNLNCGVRVLVKTRFHGQNIPIGGGSAEMMKIKFGNLEVLQTSITQNKNICFYVPFSAEYLQ